MAKTMVDPDVSDGDFLTANQWLAEFNNMLTNSHELISPLTGNIDANGKNITGLGTITPTTIGFPDTSADPSDTGVMQRRGTLFKFFDGSIPRVTQLINSQAQISPIANTAIESSLYTATVPGGALNILGKVSTEIWFRLSLLNTARVVIRAYFGGAANSTSIEMANGSGSDKLEIICPLTCVVASTGSVLSQILTLQCTATKPQSDLVNGLATLANSVANLSAPTVDSRNAQALTITVLFDSANPGNGCDMLYASSVLTT